MRTRRWAGRFALSFLAVEALGGCDPGSCEEPCDSGRTARRIAGPGAIECGIAVAEAERAGVENCMASAFATGSAFAGLVELPTMTADGAILVRGFARGGDGVLREVLGTRQPDRAIVQTRLCFAAMVESDDAGSRLRCVEAMEGVLLECQCLDPSGADAGQPSP